MKIIPTKGEFKALRSASEKLETICKPGMECETCFMNERLDGESCCPASHIISIVQTLTDELFDMALSVLPESKEK